MITITGIIICIVAFFAGLLILRIFGKLFRFSAKVLGRLIGNAIIGAVILLLFNFVGGIFGANIAITPLSSLVVGVLGIPGVILLLLLG